LAKRLCAVTVLGLFFAICAPAQVASVSGEKRPADRAAVLKSLDRIFQGFIHQDDDELRATHAAQWLGFLEGVSGVMHGVDEYMAASTSPVKSPVHMTAYKLLDSDVLFYGDVAIVPFVCEIEIGGPGIKQPMKNKLRILDVFAKLNGQWIQVATDTARSPDAEAASMSSLRTLGEENKKNLLDAREAVWRAYFANDRAKLEELLPEELIAIDDGEKWSTRQDVFADAKGFVESGGKLVRLEFPDTQIQVYGYTAIIYTKYLYEISAGGKQFTRTGRATEMFVRRQDKWLNTGWHLDSGTPTPSAAAQ
jgi:hypothetical protein